MEIKPSQYPYLSQCGQDCFVDGYFKKKTGGVFVDAGAHDGVTYSNTMFFEACRDWTGLCVEPNPDVFEQLLLYRNCICENAAIGDCQAEEVKFTKVSDGCSGISALTGVMDFPRLERFAAIHGGKWEETTVKQITFQDLFERHGITEIDYLSLDVEGAELAALAGIDFKRTIIRLMTVENTGGSIKQRQAICNLGFSFIGRLDWDDIFEMNK